MTLKSTGLYRCEISAEEPDFKTVAGEGKLEVVCKFKNTAESFDTFNFMRNFVAKLARMKTAGTEILFPFFQLNYFKTL